jgi:hypothetical protein
MGITSTGSGKAPRTSTSLVSSMMQTNRLAAAAMTFSRVSAAPPPLISMPRRGRLIGTVDIQVEIALRIEIQFRNPRRLQPFGGLARARDSALEPDFTGFQHFDELADRRAGADPEHHVRLRCRESRLPRRAVFFPLL